MSQPRADPGQQAATSTASTASQRPVTSDLSRPEWFLNRELSLLEFNRRVLDLAKDQKVPLLERLKFLCIVSSNLDEFFEVRVAGLKEQVTHGIEQPGADGLTPSELLARIAALTHQLVQEQYVVLNQSLIPQLADQRIRFLKRTEWTPSHIRWMRRFFSRELLPLLSPVGLDPAHPFPKLLNKSLNFLVTLEGTDAFGRLNGTAIVQVPRSLPRVIRLPARSSTWPHDFAFLSSVIHAFVHRLFPGMDVTGCYQFRVTRNSNLFVDEEDVDDLRRALEGQLPDRRFGDAVRLEVADNCPPDMVYFLREQFHLQAQDVYQCHGPVNLHRLMAVPDLVERPDLKFQPFTPSLPATPVPSDDWFEAIRQGDVLLHHPFQSFAPVTEFLRQAATDPHVLTIKQTLYRTGTDSAIVQSLVDAARGGKEVTVVIELRARFDEEANIELAHDLEEAGAHVVYGVVGHKTHAKMSLVLRREGRQLRHYTHLGTGNYHVRNARLYTDFGLLTCDAAIGRDARMIFQQLTSPGRPGRLKHLLQSPFTLHATLLKWIGRETDRAKQGRPAKIIAKMNALLEPQIIRSLYKASQAGVHIDLIVRGPCALRPGIAGLSDHIHVRSILGRFLEHSRVFYFLNDGDERVFLSSADWMDRNFFRRIEVAFPVLDKTLKQRVIDEGLRPYLEDNTHAWILHRDGSYRRQIPGRKTPRSAQQWLMNRLVT
ncbi:MAG: Polyphosphate kinase [Nitrospira sp.]|jgi:polyphosphate kinase|nr:MAG: Polyphosphate kinase [Nitrospira sp.]